ncbi:hypothetical protein IJO12_01750 [bacterium]|nr:hypothetical protein [bacterium]
MKKVLFSLFLATVLSIGSVYASEQVSAKFYDVKPANEKQVTKRCPCKKYFEQHLGLTEEQIKLVDANRKKQEKELKPLNAEIRANYKKIKTLENDKEIAKLRKEIAELKNKKSEVKADYNKKFESYLTKEQLVSLEHMRQLRKEGKSCCPCGKNRYY